MVLKRTLIAAALLLVFSSTIQAAEGPVGVIEDLWRQIRSSSSLADETSRERFIQDALRSHYDFQAFYQTALQDHWASWSDEQKQGFAARFETLFLQSLTRKIARLPKSGGELVAGPTTGGNDRAVVHFTGKKGDKEARFQVFFIRKGSEWKIYDVEVEGVLLSRNYRGQFNRILRNEDYSGLIAKLDRKLSS